MDMQFFIETIKSGGVYDTLKIGSVGAVKEIVSQLKSIFNGQSLTEKDYTKIAEIMKEAYKKEQKEDFITYLENSDKLKEILKDKNSFKIVQHIGNNDFKDITIHGDMNLNFGGDSEKK